MLPAPGPPGSATWAGREASGTRGFTRHRLWRPHSCVYQATELGDCGWREMEIYFMVKMTYAVNQVYESAHKAGV